MSSHTLTYTRTIISGPVLQLLLPLPAIKSLDQNFATTHCERPPDEVIQRSITQTAFLLSFEMENGAISQGEGKGPSDFLSEIIGNSVTVKLNSGVVYKGLLEFQSQVHWLTFDLRRASID